MKRYFEKHRNAAICLGLVALTLIVYWQVRTYDFVNYDDDVYVTANRQVQAGMTLDGLQYAFTSTVMGYWQPLTLISHLLDCELFGMRAGWHHLINVFLHGANTVLLFILLARMSGYVWRSAFVAALFALHPLHVESVAWVAERKDVLSTLFWMLTIWGYMKYLERPVLGRYFLMMLFFVLGLMTKPMLVTLPFALLLLDYWPLRRIRFGTSEAGSSFKKEVLFGLIREKLPLFLIAIAAGIVTIILQGQAGNTSSLSLYPASWRAANALVAYIAYLGKTIWPSGLAVFYPLRVPVPWWQLAGACAVFACISALAVWGAKRHRYLTMGWLWYVGTLLPVIGLVQVGAQAIADHFTYIPLIGIFIMIAWGGSELASGLFRSWIVAGAAAVTILCILIPAARLQVGHWANTVTLFEHALAVTEDNYVAHNNLGLALVGKGKFSQAMEHYQEALRIVPDYADAHNNMGNVLAEQELFDDAIRHYTRAVQIRPDYAEAHNNLGVALLKQGKLDDAISHFRQALQIQPDYAYAHQNLGSVYAKQGKLEDAISHYHKALRIMPDSASLHNSLANALVDSGRTEEAIRHYSRAVQIRPDYAEAHNNLGYALVQEGDFQNAINHYSEALLSTCKSDPEWLIRAT
jgi:tetratricopeptide (TPR) repeat protein